MKIRTFFSVIVVLVIIPVSYAKADGKRFLNIQEVTSPGGIHAWLVENHSVPLISLYGAFAGAGSVVDGNKQGLVQLASNTMDEGGGELDSEHFQKLLADLSVSFGYNVGRDNFSFSLKTLTRNKDKAFDLMRLSVTAPRFDAEPLARMKAANLARIRSSLSDPDWMAARLMNDVTFAGHPYANNSGGTISSLNAITAQDLHAYAKDYLSRDHLRIAVTGDITRAELEKLLDASFGALPATGKHVAVANLTIQNSGTIAFFKRDIPQTIIMMALPGINRKDPDWFAADIMNFILGGGGFGSRLTEEVREKRGLTYGIGSGFSSLDHISILSVETSTRNEKTKEVLDLIKQEMTRMRDTPVTDAELKAAKDYLTGSMPLALTSTDSISSIMISMMMDNLPSTYLDMVTDKLNAVTIADVTRVSKRLLAPDKMVTILVGNPAGVTPTKTFEKLPNVE
jgi:zinc protease